MSEDNHRIILPLVLNGDIANLFNEVYAYDGDDFDDDEDYYHY